MIVIVVLVVVAAVVNLKTYLKNNGECCLICYSASIFQSRASSVMTDITTNSHEFSYSLQIAKFKDTNVVVKRLHLEETQFDQEEIIKLNQVFVVFLNTLLHFSRRITEITM